MSAEIPPYLWVDAEATPDQEDMMAGVLAAKYLAEGLIEENEYISTRRSEIYKGQVRLLGLSKETEVDPLEDDVRICEQRMHQRSSPSILENRQAGCPRADERHE